MWYLQVTEYSENSPIVKTLSGEFTAVLLVYRLILQSKSAVRVQMWEHGGKGWSQIRLFDDEKWQPKVEF